SGRAAVETASENGSRVRLAMFGPGAVVGEIAFYTGRPRSASVVAAGPLVAWRLSRGAMRRLQADAPAAAFHLHEGIAAILAGRLASTDRLVRFLAD
ncbi:MAG: cyclic nucleotide-binding domain-containing protein, partial [Rhizobiales bacterium]|nr:cyclic nucleotide-binding domain-containing protein [Hyphomicrobiales bacterium]